jgi:hypothetical protein
MSALVPAYTSRSAPARPAPAGLGRARRLALLLSVLVMVAPPLYLSQTGGALATGYSIQKLQSERRQWQMRNDQLQLELAKARSLAWIESEAVHRLGMQRPTQVTVVQVDRPIPAGSPQARRANPSAAALTDADEPAGPEWAWLERLTHDLLDRVVGR